RAPLARPPTRGPRGIVRGASAHEYGPNALPSSASDGRAEELGGTVPGDVPHERPDLGDRLPPLRTDGGDHVEGMDHVGPDLELRRDAGRARALVDGDSVVAEALDLAHV